MKINSDISPIIRDSKIHESVLVEPFTHIINSEINKNSKIYKESWIVETTMKENTFSGDGSKLDNCILRKYSRVGKYNHLYYVKLGKHSYTGQNTVIMHTEIGSFCSISWGVTIGASEHDFNRVTSHSFLYNKYDELYDGNDYYNRFKDKCSIGNDVWIGTNSTILRGVSIGDGAVIGANTVVTKDVEPYSIVVGNPGRRIKFRFEKHIIDRLLSIKWWNLADSIITDNCDLFSKAPNNEVLNQIEKLY